MHTESLLSTEQAAQFLGVAEVTLRQWRWRNLDDQPPFIRIGRLVRYAPDDLRSWIQDQARNPAGTRKRKTKPK
jgi:predicted DNA-binding transcriptional regulator AlpA